MDEAQGKVLAIERGVDRPVGGADVDRLESLSPPGLAPGQAVTHEMRVQAVSPGLGSDVCAGQHRESVMGKVDVYAVRDGREA